MTDPVQDQLAAINSRLDRGDTRMTCIETSIAENTAMTRDVRELMEIGRAGFKVLGWIGNAAKWAGGIAAAGVAIYGAIYAIAHGGRLPPQ